MQKKIFPYLSVGKDKTTFLEEQKPFLLLPLQDPKAPVRSQVVSQGLVSSHFLWWGHPATPALYIELIPYNTKQLKQKAQNYLAHLNKVWQTPQKKAEKFI